MLGVLGRSAARCTRVTRVLNIAAVPKGAMEPTGAQARLLSTSRASAVTKNQQAEIDAQKAEDWKKICEREEGVYNMGYDYPLVEQVHEHHRDPDGDWIDPQDRRKFGEPLHEEHDILSLHFIDPTPSGFWSSASRVFLVHLGIIGFFWWASQNRTDHTPPRLYKRDMPFQNLYLECGGEADNFREFGTDPMKYYVPEWRDPKLNEFPEAVRDLQEAWITKTLAAVED